MKMNIKRNYNYLKYILRHKQFVLIASRKIGASLISAIIHDISKFSYIEQFPYAKTFYDKDGGNQYIPSESFNRAQLTHQKRNKHHWQYWLLIEDSGKIIPLEIPENIVLDMIADQMGAGRAITGKQDILEWYNKVKDSIILHKNTRVVIDNVLNEIKDI